MAISLASLNRRAAPKPPRIVIYGVHGVGKTTFGACAPNPVVIQTEDGLGTLDVQHFPLAKSFGDVMEAFQALYTEDHDFETVVIDSLDWLEPLVWAEACARNGWENIEQPGYGKGYLATLSVWREYFEAINALRDDKGMAVIQTAHADIRRFDSPETEPYDRYVIKLHARASALVQEHADAILFANWKVATTKADVGFNQKVTRAIGRGERTIYTEERPAFIAKNRYRLPPEIPMSWDAFAEAMAPAAPEQSEEAEQAPARKKAA
jgi:hypothetical protein